MTGQLILGDNDREIDLLDMAGIVLDDPYWEPNVARIKGGGQYVNSTVTDGKEIVVMNYDNVIETIGLRIEAPKPHLVIRRLRKLYEYFNQIIKFNTTYYETNPAYFGVKPNCENSILGYSRIVKIEIPQLNEVFGQPFFSDNKKSAMYVTLIIEREPYWSYIKPNDVIPVMINILKNPDFEDWNNGIADAQPDFWEDVESGELLYASTYGQNNRANGRWGDWALNISVTDTIELGELKGVTQTVESVLNEQLYTVVAWVKSTDIWNGNGRIFIEYSQGEFELYNGDTEIGWTLFYKTFTTDTEENDVKFKILIESDNIGDTNGSFTIDGLMLLEGDYTEYLANNTLPYLTSSHLVNHLAFKNFHVGGYGKNYIDIYNVPGDVDALTRVEFINNEVSIEGSTAEAIRDVRIGGRRATFNLNIFDNIADSDGPNDPDSSNGNSKIVSVEDSWTTLISKTINDRFIVDENIGRFKVFIRLKDNKTGDTNLSLRLRYFIGLQGSQDIVLNSVDMSEVNNQWSCVDVTPLNTLNIDKKQGYRIGQFGYIVEGQRPLGEAANDVQVDYIILMPTDGGYNQHDLDSSFLFGRGIGVDNTSELIDASTIIRNSSWEFWYQPTGAYYYTVATEWNDALYMFINLDPAISDPGILKLDKDFGETRWDITDSNNSVFSLISYNDRLWFHQNQLIKYVNTDDDFPDGITAVDVSTLTGGRPAFGWSMAEQDGYIWWQGSSLIAIPTRWFLEIVRVDPNTLAIEHYTYPDINVVFGAWYNGLLYLLEVSTKIVYVFNPNNLSLTEAISDLDGKRRNPIITYRDYLYFGTIDTIERYDGTNLEVVYRFNDTSYEFSSFNSKIYNGGLYLGGAGNLTLHSADGVNFEAIDPATLSVPITVFNNQLIGANTFDTGSEPVWPLNALVSKESVSTITKFKGTGFSVDNRRFDNESRSRIFVNQNRKNGINNIDDKGLIGVGFKPRFLSLINEAV